MFMKPIAYIFTTFYLAVSLSSCSNITPDAEGLSDLLRLKIQYTGTYNYWNAAKREFDFNTIKNQITRQRVSHAVARIDRAINMPLELRSKEVEVMSKARMMAEFPGAMKEATLAVTELRQIYEDNKALLSPTDAANYEGVLLSLERLKDSMGDGLTVEDRYQQWLDMITLASEAMK